MPVFSQLLNDPARRRAGTDVNLATKDKGNELGTKVERKIVFIKEWNRPSSVPPPKRVLSAGELIGECLRARMLF
jgi:hypothetical protein